MTSPAPPDPELARRIDAALSAANRAHQQGQLAQAETLYRQILDRRPDHAGALFYLGVLSLQTGRAEEAADILARAAAADPNRPAAHDNLGLALHALGRHAEAVEALRKALGLKPDYANAWYNLGNALHGDGRHEEAVQAYRRALALQPADAEVQSNLGAVLQQQGRMAEAVACYREALRIDPNLPAANDNLLFALNYLDDIPKAEVVAEHRRWGARHGAPPSRPHPNSRDPERPLRIGYVSGDLWSHSVAWFLEPLLKAHDRTAFEITAYAEVPRPDAVTERLRALTDRWRSTVGLHDRQVAEAVRADGIDILIDLAGHTFGNRLGVFALKPAPVQATWLGYPNITGLAAIDYRIVDAVTDPPGSDDAGPGEALVRLQGGFLCYGPPADAPEPGPPPSAAGAPFTLGSFNNPTKLSDATVETWAAILKRLPEARLLLKGQAFSDEASQALCRSRFAAHGIAADRLVLRPWTTGTASHLAAYAEVDLALDPFPYNGTTTTVEALWMGTPVVVLAGDRHAGRVGASLLTQVGLTSLIAETRDAYVETAVALAKDPARLTGLRRSLRPATAASGLCDSNAFARRFEAALRDMWRRWAS